MFKSFVYYCGIHRFVTVEVHLHIFVQCGNHICSVIYVKYVYCAHCNIVDCSDFIYGICMHLQYKCIKYLAFMAYMFCLVRIFVSTTYLAITWVVCVAVGCIIGCAKCRNNMPILYAGFVTYICNVAVIFVL